MWPATCITDCSTVRSKEPRARAGEIWPSGHNRLKIEFTILHQCTMSPTRRVGGMERKKAPVQMEIIKSLGQRLSPPKSSSARSRCQQPHISFVCPSHIPFPSPVKKDSTSMVTVGVAIPSHCSSTTRASSLPNLSARRGRKGSASSDPSKVNHVDHKLGLPALHVLSAKWMYTSPCLALAFQKGVASTRMTIRNFGGTRPWGCCM